MASSNPDGELESSLQDGVVGECESGVLGSGDFSPDEIDIDGLSENQSRIDSVLKFLLHYNCPKKNVGRPKKQAGKAVKDLNVITDASREKEQDFAFPDGVSENMKNLTDIRDVHPGVLLDYLVKLNDFNKKILQSVGTLHKKCNELATKLCAVSTSEATNDRLPLPQTVQAQSRPAFDVASSERSKEVELESRVDAIEQRSKSNILLCSGAIISEVIGADSGDLENKVISCVGRSLPNTTEDGDIVKVSIYGKKKTHVKIECSSASVKKRIIASARHSKPVDIYFTEFLTKYRNQMLFSLRSLKSKFRDKISAVYTQDGNLFYKLHGDDGFKSVRNPMDVTMLEGRLSGAE